MFPDDESAERWFELQLWGDAGPTCPDCRTQNAAVVGGQKRMPYHCRDCRQYFSVKKGTVMHSSQLGYQTWAIAVYQVVTGLKGVSAMKLHRDLGISYKTAWHLLHRIRKALESGELRMSGPVEVDETFVGGKEANKHESKRSRARGGVPDKAPIAGVKDRKTGKVSAKAIKNTDAATLRGFVRAHTIPGSRVYSDGHPAYARLDGEYDQRAVQHSAGTYVIGDTHTNGIESFWSMFKRGIVGTYHQISVKHLGRYACEFAGRHNLRDLDTVDPDVGDRAGDAGATAALRRLDRLIKSDRGRCSDSRVSTSRSPKG